MTRLVPLATNDPIGHARRAFEHFGQLHLIHLLGVVQESHLHYLFFSKSGTSVVRPGVVTFPVIRCSMNDLVFVIIRVSIPA